MEAMAEILAASALGIRNAYAENMNVLRKATFQGCSRAVVRGDLRTAFMMPEKPMISPDPKRLTAAAPPTNVPPRKPFNRDMIGMCSVG